MREKLLEVLAEPVTGATLRLRADQGSGDSIESGALISEATGKEYPIVRGIPRFVEGETYADSFGWQWNKFRGTQLDSVTGAGHSKARFDDETGWTEVDLKDKWVLDAGCGAGRFSEIAAARGPNLVSLDYSAAVEATKQTLAGFPNVDVIQGNLLEPPFRKGAFDYAYCIGVVQHTPDPPRVIANVIRSVRDLGHFAFTIYARRPWTKLNGKYLVRPYTKTLSKDELLGLVRKAMPVAFPITDTLKHVPVLGKAVAFALPVSVYNRGDFNREQRYEEAVLDTFDALSPQFDSPMTWQEVEAVFRAEGVARWQWRTRVPIIVGGTR
ncbi:MAG: methyltransferase domain-containing protein [Myxococcales bacterium]|nr:methyltransferase domain-containing protein [Myxococcales bacterium]MBL0197005.1 methyltransferase domain-containing protein [Myxococcales bacterium]HQY63619.1 methyltransferase domain-containing protein [Polyangiaceae bacterium]